ncbi:MAK10-like protein [Tanacetum coccineum]
MGDENLICTLGYYSKPSPEGYRITIELPMGNNVVPLRFDTIRLVQNGCSFYELLSEDPNQYLKDFLKLVDSLDLDGSITTWEDLTTRFLAQFFPPRRTVKLHNDILMFQQHHGESLSETWTLTRRTIDQSASGKLHDQNAKESWALLEDLALYDNESWNDPRDLAKPVKEISLHQDVPKGLVSNFTASQDARLSKFEADFKQQRNEMTNKIDIVLKAIIDQIAGPLPNDTVKNPKLSTSLVLSARSYPTEDPQCSTHVHVLKLNSFYESLGLVPQSSNTKLVCTKGDDGDVMFIEIVQKNDSSRKEEPEAGEQEVEYFDMLPSRSELAYHKYLMYGPIPSIFLRNPIITEGCPLNLKIPCSIGHVHVEKAYIDLNSPINIMTRMMYNWIMRRKLEPRENSNRGVSNFTRRIKGMHIFIVNFTYVIDFMIVLDGLGPIPTCGLGPLRFDHQTEMSSRLS